MVREDESWEALPFTEKAFYLAEFRGRTLALAADVGALGDPACIREVLSELAANRTHIVLLLADLGVAAELGAPIVKTEPGGSGPVWRALRQSPTVAIGVPSGEAFAGAVRGHAVGLGVTKLILLDPGGGLQHEEGARDSFADLGELASWTSAIPPRSARLPLLREIENALREGVPAVNLCTAEGLADELFSYAGSGTLFTPERYVDVRRLGLDDLDAADDLVTRGVSEGYLASRDEPARDRIFANGHGAFVEGRHLAGIGALLPHRQARAGEIASLYTLTRFLGEGVGGHLVRGLVQAARDRGDVFVFACTTSDRVVGFFEREGFREVTADEIPPEKWSGYDPDRRRVVRCLRFDLG